MNFIIDPYRQAVPASRSFNAVSSDLSSSSSPSASLSFGSEAADRVIVAVVHWATSAGARLLNTSGNTIGGVAATVAGQDRLTSGDANFRGLGFIYAPVPSGASGTVALSLTGSAVTRIACYSLYGLTVGPIETAFFKATQTITTPKVVQADVQAGGVAIAAFTAEVLTQGTVSPTSQDYYAHPSLASGNGIFGSSSLTPATVTDETFTFTPTGAGSSPGTWGVATFR